MNNHNTSFRWFLIACLVSVLNACHHKKTNQPSTVNSWQQVSAWSIKGKLAINDGQNNGSGRILWRVDDQGITAQFKAPLGQGSWTITENNSGAKLVSSKHGTTHGSHAQQLISQELGWHFPWEQLPLWLRGVTSEQQLGQQDPSITELKDADWSINYDQWQTTSLGTLPKRLSAKKSPYSVKLVIYEWIFE